MAAAVTSAALSAMDCAGREDADCPENEVTGGDAELPERQLQVPEKENAELVAEAEAVAAGWMLDFLCLSLCRAFRDGRSEDFRRTRDSAEGGCGPRTAGELSGGCRRDRAKPAPVSWGPPLRPQSCPCRARPRDRMGEDGEHGSQSSCHCLLRPLPRFSGEQQSCSLPGTIM